VSNHTSALAVVGSVPSIELRGQALTKRDDLIVEALAITKVSDPFAHEEACKLHVELKRMAREVERDRSALKAPVLDLGRKIDDCARQFTAPITDQTDRIGKLVLGYEAEVERERQASERKVLEEKARLERERRAAEEAERQKAEQARREAEEAQRKAAEALRASVIYGGHEDAANAAAVEAQAAAERAREADLAAKAAAEAPAQVPAVVVPPQSTKVEGMRRREVWVVEVINPAQLYAARPDLVQLVPRIAEITKAAANGDNLPGVNARKESRV